MPDTLLEQHRFNVEPGPDYEAQPQGYEGGRPPARIIAFYLPQFHPIPENDEWWGAGFTEWTNVTKALPRFQGHYQPRLPGALGFYDLRNPDTLRRQADLARHGGIEGFCFHHYWFDGRRLLETPLANLLANRDIDLPFCLNWANESWSRRWDGTESAILIAQRHTPEDDIAFARSLKPIFDDPRYIRIDGRPLLMVYRPSLFPDAAATVARWREDFARAGDNPYIVLAQSFQDLDPRRYGMDAAAGFPPHRVRDFVQPVTIRRRFDPRLGTLAFSYDDAARNSIAYRPREFRLFPGVCPDWDNDARRNGQGVAFVGSTPRKYGAWLEHAARWVSTQAPPEERIVFINAWNEWAEGTYLEPDRHYGYAYLSETARALSRLTKETEASDLDAIFSDSVSPAGLMLRSVRRVARKGAGAADRVGRLLRSL
ncbi:MAG: hypothetical protein QOH81_810 [Sphingomonadales bacterium]|jgi:hypothetical protein|nr:hypothetical protein [Sphingomonadales bacterium]